MRYSYEAVVNRLGPAVTIGGCILGGIYGSAIWGPKLRKDGFEEAPVGPPSLGSTVTFTVLGCLAGTCAGLLTTLWHPMIVPVAAIAVPTWAYRSYAFDQREAERVAARDARYEADWRARDERRQKLWAEERVRQDGGGPEASGLGAKGHEALLGGRTRPFS